MKKTGMALDSQTRKKSNAKKTNKGNRGMNKQPGEREGDE